MKERESTKEQAAARLLRRMFGWELTPDQAFRWLIRFMTRASIVLLVMSASLSLYKHGAGAIFGFASHVCAICFGVLLGFGLRDYAIKLDQDGDDDDSAESWKPGI